MKEGAGKRVSSLKVPSLSQELNKPYNSDSLQFNLVVSFSLVVNIKKMKGSPKIIESCVILDIFNIKKLGVLSKIIDSCVILDNFNIKKMREPSKNICFKMKTGQ